jgi:hypothetical protein
MLTIEPAGAAFASVVPGYDRRWLLLPALPLMLWLGSIGAGCLQLWSFGGPVTVGRDWSCVLLITLTGAGPAAMMAWMLRRGAPLMPRLSAALGGLAAAGMGNVVMRLVHPPGRRRLPRESPQPRQSARCRLSSQTYRMGTFTDSGAD